MPTKAVTEFIAAIAEADKAATDKAQQAQAVKHEALEKLAQTQDDQANAALRLDELQAQLRAGNANIKALDLAEAHAEVERIDLLASGIEARASNKQADKLATDHEVADLIAETLTAMYGSTINIVATHARKLPEVPKAVTPIIIVTQTSATVRRENGTIGANIGIQFHRNELFAPLDMSALAAKGRELDTVWITDERFAGIKARTIKAPHDGHVVDHFSFALGVDGKSGGAVPKRVTLPELDHWARSQCAADAITGLWDSMAQRIEAGVVIPFQPTVKHTRTLKMDVKGDVRTTTFTADIELDLKSGPARLVQNKHQPSLGWLLDALPSPVGRFVNHGGKCESFKVLPPMRGRNQMTTATVEITARSHIA